ncbi:MAG: glycosyltransferase family 4 protein [Candidatus Aminicenantes bacterium]|nr:glycosyltransferase family 4 protein [Candidatus Aminicenantes bacterium]
MRILYIGPLPPEAGGRILCGASLHGWDLARRAVRQGHDVCYLAPTSVRGSFIKEGVRVIHQPSRKWRKAWEGWRFGRGLDRKKLEAARPFRGREQSAVFARAAIIGRTIDLVRPDVVHLQTIEHGGPLSYYLQGRPVPAVATDHGYWRFVRSEADLARMKSGLGGLKRLVAVSSFAREKAVRDGFEEAVPVTVIHNPVEVGGFSLEGRESVRQTWGWGRKMGVFFSGITESIAVKGLDVLLEAFRRCERLRRSCRLVALADREGERLARRFAADCGLDIAVRTFVPRDEARAICGAADVCVVPSRSDALILVFLEALAAGVPIVGFGPSVRELEGLLETRVGEPFDAGRETPDDLAGKILAVLGGGIDRDRLREAIGRRLSWEAQFPAYDDLYRSVRRPGESSVGEGGG